MEADLIELVILLPENLFYNTSAPGLIIVINRRKRHPDKMLLINASQMFVKGRPKNYLTDEHINAIAAIYRAWVAREGISTIISRQEAARNDYNLSSGRYVATNGSDEILPLEEALVWLEEAEEERAAADRVLRDVLQQLGLSTFRADSSL